MPTGRTKASVLWGAIGALSFLVLAQGYVLLSDATVALPTLLLVGLGVLVLASAVAYAADPLVASLGE